jgi:hypothetical protein
MKVFIIDSLNNIIFSFISFSSQPVMLMDREIPDIYRRDELRNRFSFP